MGELKTKIFVLLALVLGSTLLCAPTSFADTEVAEVRGTKQIVLPPDAEITDAQPFLRIYRIFHSLRRETANPNSTFDARTLEQLRTQALESYKLELWHLGSAQLTVFDEEGCRRTLYPPNETELEDPTVWWPSIEPIEGADEVDRRDPCYPYWTERDLEQPAGRSGWGQGGTGGARCRNGGC